LEPQQLLSSAPIMLGAGQQAPQQLLTSAPIMLGAGKEAPQQLLTMILFDEADLLLEVDR
jgi:hypothetical protein